MHFIEPTYWIDMCEDDDFDIEGIEEERIIINNNNKNMLAYFYHSFLRMS